LDNFEPGDVILDKYEVKSILGKGGMGIVLAARNRDIDQLVALKFLLPHLRDKPDLSARFAREARTATRIKNDHVARVFDAGMADGVAFMVMEYLPGEDLSTMLERRGQLPIDEAVDLLLQACEAVNEAHGLRIIHRDLKPGNLFVTETSDHMPFVKVLDFGISKTTSDEASVTASAAVIGSPLYMSPEQLLASGKVDARSDVWSLVVILYEMLAAKSPFHGESVAVICTAILNGTYPRISTYRDDIPEALEDAIDEALTAERDDRISKLARADVTGSCLDTLPFRDSHCGPPCSLSPLCRP